MNHDWKIVTTVTVPEPEEPTDGNVYAVVAALQEQIEAIERYDREMGDQHLGDGFGAGLHTAMAIISDAVHALRISHGFCGDCSPGCPTCTGDRANCECYIHPSEEKVSDNG